MIAHAIPVMEAADIFVLIGSSLAVYPAAGLMGYVAPSVKEYVIDKSIPYVGRYQNIIRIEKPATEGIEDLKKYLHADIRQ